MTLCRQAGVKSFGKPALRHLDASLMERENVSPGAIIRLLGQVKRQTTEIYLHSLGQAERAVTEVYSGRLKVPRGFIRRQEKGVATGLATP